MDVAALNQLVRAAASPAAHIINQPPPRQLAANRARRATKKAPDHPLAFGGKNVH